MSAAAGRDLSLLLVEDDPLDRRIVRRHLKQARVPAHVVEAADLAAAEAALAAPYDCVLLDLDLPDGDGLELLRRLAAAGSGPSAPVVVLTGHVQDELVTRCLQAGAQDYLVKGEFGAEMLGRAIRHARERWRLLQEVRAKGQELARSNEELERFAHVASHDLQEPLRTLGALCGRLEERCGEQLDERAREYVRRIRGAGERMQRLIRDLLDLSRIQLAPLELEPTSLDAVVADVLADLSLAIAEARAEVHVEPLGCVLGGRSLLARVFGNLLANSLRFRDPARAPRIRIDARPLPPGPDGRTRVEVRIDDNGVGFHPEHAELIFLPFKRLAAGERPGSGIGLAVCRAIVERHGGSLRGDGRPGEGATFALVLDRAS